MILHSRVVEQAIDRDERAKFVKELVVAGGRVPLAMVRKRAAAWQGGSRGIVLLVHGFGQNRYAWHLPSRSFANHLAHTGFDVFNLDLRGHGRSRHLGANLSRDIEDYIHEDLPAAMEKVQRVAGARPVYLVGHSLGGLVSYAAAPALEGAVAGIVSLGSPYHFTRGSVALGVMATAFSALSRTSIPEVDMRLKPLGRAMRALRHVAESPLYPIPVRGWHKGSLEPHILEEHLHLAFDRASFTEFRRMFEWGAEKRFGGKNRDYVERFEKLDLPLFVLAGANDDLAPPPSVLPAFEASASQDKSCKVVPFGHIDMLVGRDAPVYLWPLVTRWLVDRAA